MKETPIIEKFEILTEKLRDNFEKNNIKEFLNILQKISFLFTDKLQEEIDKKSEQVKKEIKIDINPELLKAMKEFNKLNKGYDFLKNGGNKLS